MPDCYEVYVARFNRAAPGVSSNMPDHWEICVRIDKPKGPSAKSTGTILHLIGTSDNWIFERKDNVMYSSTLAWNGATKVGSVEKAKLDNMAELLKEILPVRSDPKWNCQNWVFTALQKLKSNGFNITVPRTFTDLQNLMEQAKWGWEQGEDSD